MPLFVVAVVSSAMFVTSVVSVAAPSLLAADSAALGTPFVHLRRLSFASSQTPVDLFFSFNSFCLSP